MSRMCFDQEPIFIRNQRTREAIRQDIIDQMWDLWATFTFFGIVNKAEAEKQVRKFFDNINRLAGMQIVGKGICLYVCYEKHTDKAGVHVHAFVRGINPIHAGLVQELANQELGNSSVVPYDQTQEAASYVANKYETPSYVDHDRLLIIHPKMFNPLIPNQM